MTGLFFGIVLGVMWRYVWGYPLGTAFPWVLAGCILAAIPLMLAGVRRDLKRYEWRFDGTALHSPSLSEPLPLADVQQVFLAVPREYRQASDNRIIIGYAAIALIFNDGRRLVLRLGPGFLPYVENGGPFLVALGKALGDRVSAEVYPMEKLPRVRWRRYNRLLAPEA